MTSRDGHRSGTAGAALRPTTPLADESSRLLRSLASQG